MDLSELSAHSVRILSTNILWIVVEQCFPMFLGMLLLAVADLVSFYFQQINFGQDCIYAINVTYNLKLILGQTLPNQLMFSYALHAADFIASKNYEEMKAYYHSLFYLYYLLLPVFLIVNSLIAVYTQTIFGVAKSYYYSIVVQVGCSYAFNVLSNVNIIKFTAEGRTFITFCHLCISALVRVAVESMLYFIADVPVNNWPTVVAFVVTEFSLGVWMAGINEGRSLLGVTIRNYFNSDLMAIFKGFRDKKQISILIQMLRFGLPRTCYLIVLPMSVLLSHAQIFKTYTNDSQRQDAIYDLFSFSLYGQFFRVVPTALSYCFFSAAALHYKQRYYKRVCKLILTVVIVSVAVNAIILICFVQFHVQFIFSTDKDSEYSSSQVKNLFLSCVAGSTSIIPEIVSILSSFESFFTLNYMLAVFKLIMALITILSTSRNNGDTANYYYSLSLTEGVGVCISTMLLILFIIKFLFVYKDAAKTNSSSKRKNKDKSQK
ncbi:Transmembrane domain-containing protein [Spironucleus salmonicida]|uniref:Transmembrane domain-containing protein n=1 Tax=Spironucleus salmonicida TaxID=348837 RepID=V6LQC9_9EUKA|nr:Transmembrane domain-containing protein [Spironucleus salmonicida]|eukprot:EST46790.1 Transmembrane domain-containing protein [Spironucleus salmonicida]